MSALRSTTSPWFLPRRHVRSRRLMAALPLADAAATPPGPPSPPSAEAIMQLVRTYGDVRADAENAHRSNHAQTARAAWHRAEGLCELIEHNLSLLDGYITGYRFILADLQKGTGNEH